MKMFRLLARITAVALIAVLLNFERSDKLEAASEIPVDLELVIAADASDSMDSDERWLQRVGFASAFRDPQIIQALSSGPLGRVAVTYVEWADVGQPQVIVPWTLIEDSTTAYQFGRHLLDTRVTFKRRTSISGALLFAAHLLESNQYVGTRRVIDVSGDGPNNQGYPLLRARENVLKRGIVINGLPMQLKENDLRNPFGPQFDMKKLDIYYEDCVIGGPGSFIISVKGRDQLISGIRRKLLLEIAGRAPKLVPAGLAAQPRRIDCS